MASIKNAVCFELLLIALEHCLLGVTFSVWCCDFMTTGY